MLWLIDSGHIDTEAGSLWTFAWSSGHRRSTSHYTPST